MKIIGEKINGTLGPVKKAIAERDANFIRFLAQQQIDAGVGWLDIHAGTQADKEIKDLVWLVETVQEMTKVPLCLDSTNPEVLAAALKVIHQPPLINSISGEVERLEHILSLAAEHGCQVIALAMDGRGIPSSVLGRMDVIRNIITETRRCGISDEMIYIDPLILTIATNIDSGMISLQTMRMVKAEYPNVHLTCAISNISFGLPSRSLINSTFLTLAIAAGLDSAILDPLDRYLRKALLASELLLGRDRHCLNYTQAYRSGLFGRSDPIN
ncbi:MAG: dihydropteroate synthase [Desulfobacteraceae bacterium]|nr:dihydropteroate synthase [Desulfobacteraceae bacterium]MBC2756340.1 dihydropteroate synthase [Desulfobacteraceae bacterium]